MTTECVPPYSTPASETSDDPPAEGRVEVRIVSLDAEAARHVADALRLLFAGGEQRSYPAFPSGAGTRLHLTLDPARSAGPLRSWLEASRPETDRTHPGETAARATPSGDSAPAGPPAVASPPPPSPQEQS
ncbi:MULTISPECIES: hypothetical protein [unclassified Streptomyces]|uniref:hypothetical protein n=1 Tax=unclassified Streptomyces TaxID=2593676 RepID=UPI0001D069AF|nr:conserved hypothetical protein [Streptomyces sp. e14]MYX44856.1 hypothetical protein [Streptomyces sp. SID89]NED33695.1 hypothetical protein [Streptomyces sp. SID8499]NED72223.1 hypothetical protein [Streptomyces sp. SID9944]